MIGTGQETLFRNDVPPVGSDTYPFSSWKPLPWFLEKLFISCELYQDLPRGVYK